MDYEPWPLMDYFKVVSEVFQTPRRYDAARTFHNNLRTHIRSQLSSETPTVAMVGGGADPKAGTFYPVAIENGGWGSKPYRDVGAQDALSDLGTKTTSIDYEVLLKTDPDIIVYQNRLGPAGLAPEGDEAFRRDYLNPKRAGMGANLTAVQNGAVYPAASHIQGPISTLFGMEAAAEQLYPDTFTDELFDQEQLTALTTTET
jgi:iron complex transport system substrate-binding protein